jgi:hypothetical protein
MQGGWRPYSVRVGDRWVSYQRFDPLSMLAGVAADFVEAGHTAFRAGSRGQRCAPFSNLRTRQLRRCLRCLKATCSITEPDRNDGQIGQFVIQGRYAKGRGMQLVRSNLKDTMPLWERKLSDLVRQPINDRFAGGNIYVPSSPVGQDSVRHIGPLAQDRLRARIVSQGAI